MTSAGEKEPRGAKERERERERKGSQRTPQAQQSHPAPGDLALPRHCPPSTDPRAGGRPPFLVLEATTWSVGQGRPVAQLTLLDSATGRIVRGCPAHLWRRL